MSKKRVYELAKELDMQNKELVDWLQANGYDDVKSHSSSLDGDQAQAVIEKIAAERNPQPSAIPAKGFVVRRRRADLPAPTPAATEEAPAAPPPAQAPAAAAPPASAAPSAEVEVAPELSAGAEARAPFEGGVAEAGPSSQQAGVPESAPPAAVQEEMPPVATPSTPRHVGGPPVSPGATQPPHAAEQAPAAAAKAEEGGAAKPAPTPSMAVPTPNLPGVMGPNVLVQEGVDPRTLRPTATQAVVISRPLIPVRRITPPGSQFRQPPTAAPGRRAIGEVREVRVVPDSLGRGRDFIDVTKDRGGRRRGGPRPAPTTPAGPPSKQDLLALASGRPTGFPVRARKRRPTRKGAKTQITTPRDSKRVVRVEEAISVADLSQRIGVKANELIRKLMRMNVMASINQMLDVDTAQLLAADYDYIVEKAGYIESDLIVEAEDRPEDLVARPPVVTIMGHVDHGKTSLLDAIRSARVAKGEAGGITQHIGAYSVQTSKGAVTFLDTPGHEAFTAMRARGARVTDVAVLVVAADDGVMPQTIESINHAKAAEVPIIVAITKIDKPEINPDRVKQMLAEHGLVPEDWGGETIIVPVSAKTGENLDQLLEYIALQSEILELQANPNKLASGVVVESKLEKGRGPVATVLVREGTLKVGDSIVTGTFYGRLRAMSDYVGKQVKEVGPGYPVEVIGLSGVPNSGDDFHVVKDIKAAEEIATNRDIQERKKDLSKTAKISLEELFARVKAGEQKELRIILKADVHGSTEALAQSLEKLTTAKVRVRIIHRGVGAVTESDVNLAKASDALVIGFNTRPESKVNELARSHGIDVRLYNVIYDAVDEVRLAMEGLLDVLTKEKVVGKLEVRALFSVPRFGQIAGSFVTDGKVNRSSFARVIRNKKPVFQGKVSSLRRFKDDVREVVQGFECGIALEGFTGLEVGDVIEAFELEQIRQTL